MHGQKFEELDYIFKCSFFFLLRNRIFQMIREIFFVARSLEDHEISSSFETWHPMSLQITPSFLFGNERDYDTFSTIENSESYSEMISSKIIDPFTRSRLFDYSYNLHLTFAFNLYEKKTTKDRRVNFPIISDRILIESEARSSLPRRTVIIIKFLLFSARFLHSNNVDAGEDMYTLWACLAKSLHGKFVCRAAESSRGFTRPRICPRV